MSKMLNKGMMSSKTDDWATPQEFFDMLNDEFHFTLDVCASLENAKVGNFLTKNDNQLLDGLGNHWATWKAAEGTRNVCWMNPPYGRQIGKWIAKAYEQSFCHGATVVCLIPSRTDTRWWHDFVMKGEIRFVKGRLKFGGCKNNAPFPSAVVVFRPAMAVKDK